MILLYYLLIQQLLLKIKAMIKEIDLLEAVDIVFIEINRGKAQKFAFTIIQKGIASPLLKKIF